MADRLPRVRALDLALLASVPVALVGVYLLPAATRADLALRFSAPTLLTAFTMHYVHLRPAHLLTVLVVYLLVAPVAYGLARRAGRLTLFRAAVPTFTLALPFALSWLDLLFPWRRVGFGFSGIDMAFLGFLALMVVEGAGPDDDPSAAHAAPGLFFAGTGIITALAVPTVGLRLGVVAAATGAAGLYLLDLPGVRSLGAGLTELARSEGAELTVAGLVVFLLVPFAAFPPHPAGAGRVLNLYGHLLGYCFGFIVPYATLWLFDADWPGGPPEPDPGRAEVTDAD